jgi:hypothetical protein
MRAREVFRGLGFALLWASRGLAEPVPAEPVPALPIPAEPVSAGPLTLEVSPNACTTRDDLAARVRHLLGQAEVQKPVLARVHMTLSPDGAVHLRMEMWVNGEQFGREVDVQDCEAATGAAALVLALAIRPDLEVAEPKTAPSPGPEAAQVGSDAPPVDSRRAADASAEAPTQELESAPAPPVLGEESHPVLLGTLSLGYAASVFLLPGPLHGIALAGGVRRGALEAELYGVAQLPLRVELSNDTGRGGQFSSFSVGLRGCYRASLLATQRVDLEGAACAQAEAGQIRASGFGLGSTGTRERLLSALGGGVRVDLGLGGPSRLRLGGSLLAPLVRDTFEWVRSEGRTEAVATMNEVFARFEVALVLPL